jgi:hypothetical protein
MEQLGFSFGVLILAILLIYSINPRYCSRCTHGTISPMYQHFRKNPNYPIIPYCLKCFFWINLSEYKCDDCGITGTHRIHKMGFIQRWLVIKKRKNAYKNCQCGNIVELTQQ